MCRALHTLLYVSVEQSKNGKSTSINAAHVHQAVPFLSVAFDLAHAVLLNPAAAGIPGASTIQHGRA